MKSLPTYVYTWQVKAGSPAVFELKSFSGPKPYEVFHVRAKKSGKETITFTSRTLGQTSNPRRPDAIVNNPERVEYPSGKKGSRRLTGLFARLGAEYPCSFVGGFPDSGSGKDRDRWLVVKDDAGMRIYVYENFGPNESALVNAWKEGDLDRVEPPK